MTASALPNALSLDSNKLPQAVNISKKQGETRKPVGAKSDILPVPTIITKRCRSTRLWKFKRLIAQHVIHKFFSHVLPRPFSPPCKKKTLLTTLLSLFPEFIASNSSVTKGIKTLGHFPYFLANNHVNERHGCFLFRRKKSNPAT